EVYQEITGRPHERQPLAPGELLADSLNNRGVSLFDLGKRDRAEEAWQEALRVQPHHPEATYNRGLVQWRSGRMTDDRLLVQLREVGSLCADPGRVDYLLGLVHLERSDRLAAM